MAEINTLNVTDASNTARFPEGMRVNAVNNQARALEGIIARWYQDNNGTIAVTGTTTCTAGINVDTGFALYDGFTIVVDFTSANTGAVTLNLTPDGGSALGAKGVKKSGSAALIANDIGAGSKVILMYDGTNFQMLSQIGNDVAGDLTTHMADTSTHGTSGDIVGTSDSQTLTNKILTTPEINGVVSGTITSINGVAMATSQYTTAEESKLSGIEASADVTDAANVTTAGALMDSELTAIADVKALDQSVVSGANPTFGNPSLTSINSVTAATSQYTTTLDTKLDGIETSADVTDSTNVLSSLTSQEVVATGFTGTLDGILGGGTPAAVTATTGSFSGVVVASTVPSLGTHLTNKTYVDNIAAGISSRGSVQLGTTANITLSGEQTIDGVLSSTDDILVKNQSSASENGVYKTGAGAWSRLDEFDTYDKNPGSMIVIEEGTANGDKIYICTSNIGGVLDTTAIAWTIVTPAATTLDGLTDTTLSSNTSGDVLTYTGSAWVNQQPAVGLGLILALG